MELSSKICMGILTCLLLCFCMCGCLALAQDDDKPIKAVDNSIEYTFTKNSRIQVLSTSVITANRKASTTYWLLCIDGYKYLAATQSSGVALSQMFFDRETPLMCTKQDRD